MYIRDDIARGVTVFIFDKNRIRFGFRFLDISRFGFVFFSFFFSFFFSDFFGYFFGFTSFLAGFFVGFPLSFLFLRVKLQNQTSSWCWVASFLLKIGRNLTLATFSMALIKGQQLRDFTLKQTSITYKIKQVLPYQTSITSKRFKADIIWNQTKPVPPPSALFYQALSIHDFLFISMGIFNISCFKPKINLKHVKKTCN